jgi:O-antigen ligase
MNRPGRLRSFFLFFMFLAFFIDNPFTSVFGEYQAFTEIPGNLFFANLSFVIGIPLPYSLYEWTLFLTAFALFVREPHLRNFPSGTLGATVVFWGYVIFWVFVSALFLQSDRQAMFWDFKGLITAPFVMFIFSKLFPKPEDLILPAKVFAGVIFLKCVQALFLNAFVWDASHRTTVGYLIDHAASYQISTVILIAAGAMIFRYWRPRGLGATLATAVFLTFLLLALVLNERRTEMVGFFLSLGLMGSVVALQRPGKTLMAIPFATVGIGLYIAAFSKSEGVLGKPIQLLMSLTEKDDLSNLYRVVENYNLFATLSANPFFGQGFGKPMKDVAGLSAFLEGDFFLLHPHNSILGFWSQVGAVGLAFFMLLFAVFAFHAARSVVAAASPLALVIGTVVLANLFRYVIFSVGDQLFLHSSSNFVLGASMGAIVVLARSQAAKQSWNVRGRRPIDKHQKPLPEKFRPYRV